MLCDVKVIEISFIDCVISLYTISMQVFSWNLFIQWDAFYFVFFSVLIFVNFKIWCGFSYCWRLSTETFIQLGLINWGSEGFGSSLGFTVKFFSIWWRKSNSWLKLFGFLFQLTQKLSDRVGKGALDIFIDSLRFGTFVEDIRMSSLDRIEFLLTFYFIDVDEHFVPFEGRMIDFFFLEFGYTCFFHFKW